MIRHALGSLLIFSVLICSCNRKVAESPSPESLVIFPPPPDTTRLQFLTHISTSDDLRGRKGAFQRYLFGEEEPMTIIKPYGVAVSGKKIYICDTGLSGLEILNLEEGSFEYFIPGGKGQLQLPINCFVDQRGYLFIADANRRQIVVFDEKGQYLDAFGESENFKPTDVLVYEDKIWVCSVQDHALYAYNLADYTLAAKLPKVGAGEEGFIRQPTNIACRDGILYVSDFGDFNIKKYSLQGDYLGTIGSYGNVPGMFTRPKGIALDQESNLYAVDAAFENVQIFNTDGALLLHFGGSYHGDGAMGLPAAVEISYENLSYFEPYVDQSFELKYLVYVTNQYGPAKVNVYGFVKERPVSP